MRRVSEESGGISIKGHIPEGDGVLMGMLMAELVAYYGKSPEVLLGEVMKADAASVTVRSSPTKTCSATPWRSPEWRSTRRA